MRSDGRARSEPERARARSSSPSEKMRAEAQGGTFGTRAEGGDDARGARGAARGRARKARMRAFDAFVETCGDRDRTSGATRVRGARRVASRRVPSSGERRGAEKTDVGGNDACGGVRRDTHLPLKLASFAALLGATSLVDSASAWRMGVRARPTVTPAFSSPPAIASRDVREARFSPREAK